MIFGNVVNESSAPYNRGRPGCSTSVSYVMPTHEAFENSHCTVTLSSLQGHSTNTRGARSAAKFRQNGTCSRWENDRCLVHMLRYIAKKKN